MELTKEEQIDIKQGIYRFSPHSGYTYKGTYRDTLVLEAKLAEVMLEDNHFNTDPKKTDIRNIKRNRTYFPDTKSFFTTWIKGYKDEKSQFGQNKAENALGFELYYVNWHQGSKFYTCNNDKNAEWEGLTAQGSHNPIIIAADLNGTVDQFGYMNLGINDLRTGTVVVFRGKDGRISIPYDELSDMDKQLKDDINYYLWKGKEEFPFSSPNPLKAINNMWVMIGLDPLEVYTEVAEQGFIFPKNT